MMSMRRIVGLLGVLVGLVGLVSALPGCGGNEQETLDTGEIKITAPVNPAPKSVPVQEEYKSMDPAGQVKNIK
jgi:hypothetical protein